MPLIELRYGDSFLPFEYDDARFDVIEAISSARPLTDAEIGARLDSPIGSPPIEEVISPGETVLFVVPDATRQTSAGQVINLLVRRLIANGTMPHEMAVIFATGIHRPVTEEEKREIVTPFIAQRLKLVDHDARNPIKIFDLGETSTGIPVELNWMLTEYDHVVTIGGVTFHYFAGFTGGRKLVCPGLASAKTISETHKLAFDCSVHDRREGVGPGRLDGNAVNEAFIEAAAKVRISFAVNAIVNESGAAEEIFCGDWQQSHRAACEHYAATHTVDVEERREIVIASCGGAPYDINLIQAHKALEAASEVCADGGTIILMAQCRDGLGRTDFLDWFTAANSGDLARRLCADYQVNGQTAWSLLRKAERFNIHIVSSIDDAAVAIMRLNPAVADAWDRILPAGKGYILPHAGRFRYSVRSQLHS